MNAPSSKNQMPPLLLVLLDMLLTLLGFVFEARAWWRTVTSRRGRKTSCPL